MKITCVFGEAQRKGLDALIAGAVEEGGRGLPARAQELLKSGRFKAKRGETFYLPPSGTDPAAVWVGLGKPGTLALEHVREALAKGLQAARRLALRRVAIAVSSFKRGRVSLPEVAGVCGEMGPLALYEFTRYKSEKPEDGRIDEIVVVFDGRGRAPARALARAVEEAHEVAETVCWARDLSNEPANIMTPRRFASEVQKMARHEGVRCTVLGPAQMRKQKMGGILAVSQGSPEPPQLIVLEYRGAGKSHKPVALVGKGITFDSGGISIKPAAKMEYMKFDMCGAAAVAAAFRAASRLRLKVNLLGVVPACENLPAVAPQRPGDIIRMYSGKTVEVINTDAEGRLILGDALAYAAARKPSHVIDLATLTGACAVTFADQAIGLMGNDEGLLKKVQAAGERVGERCWPLPLWDEYEKQIKSDYADMKNVGTGYGGTITAGLFLKKFVGATPWAHLDIAGVAWVESPKAYVPYGASGVGVRLLIDLLREGL